MFKMRDYCWIQHSRPVFPMRFNLYLHLNHSVINYLAHAYLSFDDPAILLGNMISDFVKGKKQYDYPAPVQCGLRLHRAIDDFTDHHPATAAIKEFFRPHYRLYSGAFTDVLYDYFLANDLTQFKDQAALKAFATRTYQTLEKSKQYFPERFATMFPYMQQQDWLSNYAQTWGIEKGFGGLVRRSVYLTESSTAFNIFIANLPEMRYHYNNFFPELKEFAAGILGQFLKQ